MPVMTDPNKVALSGEDAGETIISSSRDYFDSSGAEEMIRKMTRLIKRETNLGVRDMQIYLEGEVLVLTGYCRTFYTKQLAQEAAMKIMGNVSLVNRIRVV